MTLSTEETFRACSFYFSHIRYVYLTLLMCVVCDCRPPFHRYIYIYLYCYYIGIVFAIIIIMISRCRLIHAFRFKSASWSFCQPRNIYTHRLNICPYIYIYTDHPLRVVIIIFSPSDPIDPRRKIDGYSSYEILAQYRCNMVSISGFWVHSSLTRRMVIKAV